MDELLLVIPAGLVAFPAYLALRLRFGEIPSVRYWAGAWCVLVLSGALDLTEGSSPLLGFAAEAAANLFVVLVLAGTLAFTRDPRLDRLFPAAWLWVVAAGLLRAVDRTTGEIAGSLVCSLGLAASAALVWGHSRRIRAGASEHALALAFGVLAILQAVDLDLPGMRAYTELFIATWLVAAGTTAILQLVIFVERSFSRERTLRRERELLRRVTQAAEEGEDPRGALAGLVLELRHGGPIPFITIWSLEGEELHLVDWGSAAAAGAVPKEALRWTVDNRFGRAVLASRESVLFENLKADPELGAFARRTGTSRVVACQARIAGELAGVVSAVLDESVSPEPDLMEFVGDLADAVGLVLANIKSRDESTKHEIALAAGRGSILAMIEAVPMGILLTDRAGRVRMLNSTMADQYQLGSPAEWTGRDSQELLEHMLPLLEPEARKGMDEVLASFDDPALSLERQELRFRDDERLLRLSARPVQSPGGQPLGRVWISQDGTGDSEMAARLQQADRMETLGNLAGGLAHDFSNHLTRILGNTRLLLDGLAPDDSRRPAIEDLEHSAEHCAELTRGLLVFAQKEPVELSPVALPPLLAEVEGMLRPSLPPGVRLRVEVVDGTPVAAGDETQLRRVLTNLVVNARDAVGGIGTIEVEVAPAAHGSELEIIVRDDGMGVDEGIRRRIFDPFFTTKGKGGGTGLGLAVVYGIVEAHGGRIRVRSETGYGSEFIVHWPAATETSGDVRAFPPEAAAGEGTILVAEDEPGVRHLACRALERAGYRVLEAEDGEGALEVYRRHREEVDLLVLDLSMPRLDGLSALARIRAQAPQLPALIMSGHPDRGRPAAWPSDASLLEKPFGPRQLLARVAELLGEG